MASAFNGIDQYLTFADLAAHDMTAAAAFTVAAVVKTTSIIGNGAYCLAHVETNVGWKFGRFNTRLLVTATNEWGVVSGASVELAIDTWYGIAATRPASSNIVTYWRFNLETQTMASDAVNQSGNGYSDGASQGVIGAAWSGGVAASLWSGSIARAGIDMGVEHTQQELKDFFNGNATPSWDSRWDLPGLTDSGTAGATLTNVGTTTTDDPPVIGATAAVAMQRQGGQMIGRRYV